MDAAGWPRTRVVHPVWEGDICWVTGFPTAPKRKDLAANPRVSLAYDKESFTSAYAECCAEWVTDRATQQHAWDYIKSVEPPLRFDPATIYQIIESPRFGLLKLTPVRKQIYDAPARFRRWEDSAALAP